MIIIVDKSVVKELAIGSIGINICFGKNVVKWMLGEYKVNC